MSTTEDSEQLARRIWIYRSRGMTLEQIAKAVGKAKGTISYHLRQVRSEAYAQVDAVGEQEAIGEVMLAYRELRQEALRNMTQADQASPLRKAWLEQAQRCLDSEVRFLTGVGLIRKAADKVDVAVRDVRKMTDEEIQREIQNLRDELATNPPAEILNRIQNLSN